MKQTRHFLSLLCVAILTACSPVQSIESSKNAVEEYDILIEQEILWTDCLSQEEPHYLVFAYSEKCSYCHEIMGDVLDFAASGIVKTYFVDIKKEPNVVPISNDIDETIGATNVGDIFIMGTPTILEIENNTIKANVPGKDYCLTFLNEQRLLNKK